MKKARIWLVGVLGWIFLGTARAVSQSTNSSPIDIFEYPTIELTSTNRSIRVMERYAQEFTAKSHLYYDRFGTPTYLNWITTRYRLRYGIFDEWNDAGTRMVRNMFGESAEETAVNLLPLEDWKDSGQRWGAGFLTGLFRGSFANTDELHTDPVNSQPSYNTLRHLTHFEWQSADGSFGTEYGWRPWRDNPYVYLNSDFGHMAGRQLLRTEVRCYGYLRPSELGLVKVETQAILTLSRRTQLVMGGVVFPTDMDSVDHGHRESIRLETSWCDSVFSIGTVRDTIGQSYSFMYYLSF